MTNSAILWRGRSMLDGAPIMLIATGLTNACRNTKTGKAIVQTWIVRADISPCDAINSGADYSICGNCKLRGRVEQLNGASKNVDRACYVLVFMAPQNVWKTAQRGVYPSFTLAQGREALAGHMVRLGAYGDPAAVPVRVWRALLRDAAATAGYTHQWRAAPHLQQWCMASCDSPVDYVEAKAQGWRTFRVRRAGEELAPREIQCPASAEAGHKTTCDQCKACGGNSAKAKVDIAIIAHGAAHKVAAFEARMN